MHLNRLLYFSSCLLPSASCLTSTSSLNARQLILDRILLDLPIMKKMGQHFRVEVTALRHYEDFASDVKERLQSS